MVNRAGKRRAVLNLVFRASGASFFIKKGARIANANF
jgi:hypothetical protein